MSIIKKNRIVLKEKKEQLGLAQTGKDLLEDRLGALLSVFQENIRKFSELRKAFIEITSLATKSLAICQAVEREKLVLSAMSPEDKLGLIIEQQNVMGIKTPSLKLVKESVLTKEVTKSPISSSLRVDHNKELYRKQIAVMVDLAEQQKIVEELGREIKKTRNRFNALDKITIPELKNDIREISLSLDEKERDEMAKLRVFRKISKN